MPNTYSLCPGGAMMLHESVAEFDPNKVMTQEEVDKKYEESVQTLNTECKDYCPVTKVADKIRPYYEDVKNLCQVGLVADTSNEALDILEKVSDTATRIAEHMRLFLVKQNAVMNFMRFEDHYSMRWQFEPIAQHLGFFLNNYTEVMRKGYSNIPYECRRIAFFDGWAVDRMISVYIGANQDLPELPFNMNRIMNVTNYDKAYDVFSSTNDLFECMLNDKARMERLTAVTSESYDLETVINHCSGLIGAYPIDPVKQCSMSTKLVNYISLQLRLIKTGCYDLQCEITDADEFDFSTFPTRVRPLVTGIVNIFTLAGIKLFSDAMSMANTIAVHEAIEIYKNKVLAEFNKGGIVQ